MADENVPTPQSKGDWIQLHNRNDGSLPSPPSEAYKEEQWGRGGKALEDAVEGKAVDVENGV